MSGKKNTLSNTGANVPYWVWAEGSPFNQPIDEWEPTPEQLGWKADDDNHDATPNMKFDEPTKKGPSIITPEEQRNISERITENENLNTYVARSHRVYEESVALTQLNDYDELVVDRFAEAVKHKRAGVGGGKLEISNLAGQQQYLSTQDIAAAQDFAVPTWSQASSSRNLLASPNSTPKGSTIWKPRSRPLSGKALDVLLTPPDLPRVPLTTKGLQLGAQSLEASPAEDTNTFTLYATDKLSGLNPGNCDGELLADFYAAMLHKEEELAKEGRIDQRGRPLTNAGEEYGNHAARSQTLQGWFHEAMLSVDRVVGRHVAARKGSVGETFVEAPPTAAMATGEPHLALKTFRPGMYRVLERKPIEE